MKVHYKKVLIPHLGYTIHFKRYVPAPEIPNAFAYVRRYHNRSEIYLKPETHFANAAHEITHALQFMADEFNIDFVMEREHMAYLMQHLLGECYGCKWR